jgi:response regulator RpfG family c-di-GMP phosphodiesterase
MPEMDGLEASRRIVGNRAKDRRPKIIALTADALSEDRQKCLDAGMDDYLSKPVRLADVVKVLERWGKGVQSAKEELRTESGKEFTPFEQEVLKQLKDFGILDERPFIASLIKEFLKSVVDMMDALASAQARGDANKVGHLAHTLKGSFITFNLPSISSLCSTIEKLSGEGDPARLGALIEELRQSFDRVKPDLDKLRVKLEE